MLWADTKGSVIPTCNGVVAALAEYSFLRVVVIGKTDERDREINVEGQDDANQVADPTQQIIAHVLACHIR
jgi:hypothetical protein